MYSSVLPEEEYHMLANSTIHDLLEKLEEYGDSVEIDGIDVDYANEVLTLKHGNFGTCVINKQTPNRQTWMSSPLSGPSRFDWDQNTQAWIYRRTKRSLIKVSSYGFTCSTVYIVNSLEIESRLVENEEVLETGFLVMKAG
ncbi:frataxin, mitochondrial [Olea europaea subsp. europaea]|uniref:ferroxidase n=1 Tax=Olea europaea subsp. europaea TaxID=158383 RepID=A0A8S0RLA2_OLEEU|nr:frataxin, mitochondrial [Olea europaea subsp. europaea]